MGFTFTPLIRSVSSFFACPLIFLPLMVPFCMVYSMTRGKLVSTKASICPDDRVRVGVEAVSMGSWEPLELVPVDRAAA